MTLADLDGRTRASLYVRQAIASITEDLGGADRLSAAEQALVEQAALAGAMRTDVGVRWLAGESIDPSAFSTICNTERRALETVGLKRQPRDVTPSLHEYLAHKAAAKAADSISATAVPADAERASGHRSDSAGAS